MASNFTTGIPEFDRLTENKIENGSFLLLTGNDDEGIASFSAAIEKSIGRPAEKEVSGKNGCAFLKITPENRDCWRGMCFENKKQIQIKTAQTANQAANQTKQEAFTENDLEMIIFIESLSELFQNGNSNERYPAQQEECQTVSFVKEIKTAINTQNAKPLNTEPINTKPLSCEGSRQLVIGCLHGRIFSKKTEERLKHLADSVIRFQIKETGGKIERRIWIIKYKGVDASGNIFKYTIERGKIQIENKKRIY
jgi:hypothetical protein